MLKRSLLFSPDEGGSSGIPGPLDTDKDSLHPTSGDPKGDISLATKKFDDGFGKGVRRGRKEGVGYALSELGFDGDLDGAKEKLSSLLEENSKPAKKQANDVRETEEYQSLAKEYRLAGEKIGKLEAQTKKLEAYEKRALETAIKSELVSRGVVADNRLAALVKLNQNKFRIGDTGDLEILRKMPDGSMVNAGENPEDFFKALIKENEWAIAPGEVSGAGSGDDKAKEPPSKNPFGPRPYDKDAAIAAHLGIKRNGDVD